MEPVKLKASSSPGGRGFSEVSRGRTIEASECRVGRTIRAKLLDDGTWHERDVWSLVDSLNSPLFPLFSSWILFIHLVVWALRYHLGIFDSTPRLSIDHGQPVFQACFHEESPEIHWKVVPQCGCSWRLQNRRHSDTVDGSESLHLLTGIYSLYHCIYRLSHLRQVLYESQAVTRISEPTS